jgi:hypothetical protein
VILGKNQYICFIFEIPNMEKQVRKAGQEKPRQQATKTPVVTTPPKQQQAAKTGDFAFSKDNYRIMFIGLAFIILGFILMIGGGSKDPNVFNPAIFDFQRLTLAPILVMAGYVIEIFAIMRKPKD